MPIETINNYRSFLKVPKTRSDVFVPSDEEMLKNYEIVKNEPILELIYSILATSGIRFIECLYFLKNFDKDKFKIHKNFVSYNLGYTRHTKNINNIYLPIPIYERLIHTEMDYRLVLVKMKRTGCKLSLKYLRKWNYNFMLYNSVPESVADLFKEEVTEAYPQIII